MMQGYGGWDMGWDMGWGMGWGMGAVCLLVLALLLLGIAALIKYLRS
jgi:hypothetical protein